LIEQHVTMLYLDWISCPHCEFRWRVCVETAGPVPSDRLIVVRCPNDNSAHRVPLGVLKTVAELPADVEPGRLEDFEEARPASRIGPGVSAPPSGIGPIAAWVWVVVCAAAVSLWLLFR
jgi:hypothetical protein